MDILDESCNFYTAIATAYDALYNNNPEEAFLLHCRAVVYNYHLNRDSGHFSSSRTGALNDLALKIVEVENDSE